MDSDAPDPGREPGRDPARDPGSDPGQDPGKELERRRRARNWALLIVLFGLALLFYAITIAKMTGHQ